MASVHGAGGQHAAVAEGALIITLIENG